MRLAFTKMQGAGNDFVVIEPQNAEIDWSHLALAVCNRHYGVGADGLLVLSPSRVADIRMRIFNADGSEASACGNGTRCVAKYCVEHHRTSSTDGRITIETLSGVRDAWYLEGGEKSGQVRIAMGVPVVGVPLANHRERGKNGLDIAHQRITVRGMSLELELISLGNPHAVHFTESSLADFPVSEIGKVLDLQMFRGGVNFEVARVVSRKCIEARVWEHGVGETLACGSGACSIAVAAHLKKAIDSHVEVCLPGGPLSVEWDGRGEVFLTGPAQTVFQGEWVDGEAGELEASSPIKNEVLA